MVVISEDSYYRGFLILYKDLRNMPLEERAKINYEHPDSLDHELLYQHLLQLQKGHAVQIPCYDHNKHLQLKETKTISRHHIIVLEGILLFIERQLREIMDIRIFMDTLLLDICLLRRLQRDIVERGRSLESIITQYTKNCSSYVLSVYKAL